jgi:hypothetical protein
MLKSEKRIQLRHLAHSLPRDEELVAYWTEVFNFDRHSHQCKAFVSGEFAKLYLKTAKECGAIKGRFCADGSVMVTFKTIPYHYTYRP